MIAAPLDQSYKLYANVRPVKIAYFLGGDDEASLTRILRLVCTQWGGIRHFLIPVEKDGSIEPYFAEILKTFDPDMFVSFMSVSEARDRPHQQDDLRKLLEGLLPDRRVEIKDGDGFEKQDTTAHALHVIAEEELGPQRPPLWSCPLAGY